MPNFENEPHDNTELESVNVEGEHCTVEIAGFTLVFRGTKMDEEAHLMNAWNPDQRAIGREDIPPVIYQKSERAAEKAFGFEPPFEVTQGMLRDAKKYELFHEHGEEEVERMEREQNRPAMGEYVSEKKSEQNQKSEEDETGKQGELNFPKDQ